MQKKQGILMLILSAILIISLSVTAIAADTNTYYLKELDLNIELSSEYIVFTRDIKSNDPNLSSLGLTRDGLLSYMKANNIYLNATEKNGNYEIIVTMIESSIADFSLVDDSILNAIFSSMKDEYSKYGITAKKWSVYQHKQTKFLKVNSTQENNGNTVYSLQYYTVCGKKAINVTMHSYTGPINSTMETVLKEIVDSVSFGTLPSTTPAPSKTNAFTYVDPKSGVKFVVPENWEQKPLNKERETIDVKFSSTIDQGMSILFGCTDIWEQLSASEKTGYTRADLDSSSLSKEDIASIIGYGSKDIQIIKYGGKDYFISEETKTDSSFGINLLITMTTAFRIENGYYFRFAFSGDSKSVLYKDFEMLLTSVEYPFGSTTSNKTTDTSDLKINTENASLPSVTTEAPTLTAWNIVFSLILTILVYSVPIIIYRYGIKKEPVNSQKAKKITIIYAVIAFVVMSVILLSTGSSRGAGAAIFLWSWVNYKVLTGGISRKAEEKTVVSSSTPELKVMESGTDSSGQSANGNTINALTADGQLKEMLELNPAQDTSTESVESVDNDELKDQEQVEDEAKQIKTIAYCRECGTRLNAEAVFCPECGTKVGLTPDRQKDEKPDVNPISAEDIAVQRTSIHNPLHAAPLTFQKDGLPPILRRAFILAEDGEWEKADGYFEKVLDEEPENAYAYLGMLLVKSRISEVDNLRTLPSLYKNKLFLRAIKYADEDLKKLLQSIKKDV